VNIIGTTPQSIEIAEDRKLFAAMLDKLGFPSRPTAPPPPRTKPSSSPSG
jgi:carbamoylphosphate synthase large subunit